MRHTPAFTPTYEDPLTYLPRKPVQQLTRRCIVYDQHQLADRVYVVIRGHVKVMSAQADGMPPVTRIVRAEGFFGESALLETRRYQESAVVIDDATLMSWTRSELEQRIQAEPRLGMAMMQYMVRQCIELEDRIENMALCKTPERVVLSLLQLAATLGQPNDDGSKRMTGLTHETISEYVGTSREVVTHEMSRLRACGLVQYSRKHIDVYIDGLVQLLRDKGLGTPLITTEMARLRREHGSGV